MNLLVNAIDALEEGKKALPVYRNAVAEGDTGGVSAQGESVQALGVTNLPNRPRRNPLEVSQLNAHRQGIRGSKSLSKSDDDGTVEITGDIDEANEDPKISEVLESTLNGLSFLDDDDSSQVK